MEGRVYFIRAEGLPRVKIGYTTGKFSTRKDGIQTMSPVELSCLGVLKVTGIHPREIEKELHEIFGHYRIWGEWFEFPKEELACLKKCFRRKEVAFNYETFKAYWKRTKSYCTDVLATRKPNEAVRRLSWKFDTEWV